MRLYLKWVFAVGVACGTFSCATPARQTEAFLKGPRDIPEVYEISTVPFIDQAVNFCGPATLAMAMHHAGYPVRVEDLAPQTVTPGRQGTFQADMISASRRQGMIALPISGIPALLREIAVGNPVIVLQNLAFKWYPRWHYSIAFGYDLKEADLLMHSGHDAFKRVSLRKFERNWELGNYWGMVVLPPSQLAATGDDLSHAANAAAFEKLGKRAEADQVYRNILNRWPGSLSALIGMGNLRYAAKDFSESARYLREAVEKHPESAMAWHNLAFAEAAAKNEKRAQESARRALTLVGPNSLGEYQASLREVVAF